MTKVDTNDDGPMCIGVDYEDGDKNLCSLATFKAIMEKSSIPIGNVGFKFIKKFQHHWYSGRVVRILKNEKWICKFNNGEHKEYTLGKICSIPLLSFNSIDVSIFSEVGKVCKRQEHQKESRQH